MDTMFSDMAGVVYESEFRQLRALKDAVRDLDEAGHWVTVGGAHRAKRDRKLMRALLRAAGRSTQQYAGAPTVRVATSGTGAMAAAAMQHRLRTLAAEDAPHLAATLGMSRRQMMSMLYPENG
jgi:hypothetical protein